MKSLINFSVIIILTAGQGSLSVPSIDEDLSKINNYISTLSWAQNSDFIESVQFIEILRRIQNGDSAINFEKIDFAQKAQEKIEKIVHKLFENFSMPCRKQLGKMVSSVVSRNVSSNSTYFKMMDYSTKLTNPGKLSASFILLGDYEGCLELEEEDFIGQYCVISLKRQWVGYRQLIKEVHGSFGICVPSTCSENDFRKKIHGKDLKLGSLKMLQGSCQTKIPPQMDEKAHNVLRAVVVYVGILVFCTLLDYFIQYRTNTKTSAPEAVKAFSLYTNIHEFTKPNETFEFLKIFNGLRVTLIVVVIIAHGYFAFICRALIRPRDFGKYVYTVDPIILSSQPVDVFFLISGTLMTMQSLGDMTRGFKMFIRRLVARYIRLFQMVGFMVFVVSPLFPYIAKGPLGFETWDITKNGCDGIEWRFLTFTSSLMDSFQCHPHLWHLSTDMQLSLISPIFILIAVKYPKFGNIFTICVIFGLAVTFAIRFYIYEFEVNIISGDHATFLEYSKWWVRLGPYLMGMLLGKAMFFEAFTNRKKVLSKEQKVLGWTVAITSLVIIYILALPVTQSPDGFRHFSAADAAIYKGFKKILLPLAFAWLLYANFHGYGGFLGRILSNKFFQPLSKVNFSFFVLHMPYQLFKASQLWSPVEFQYLWVLNSAISDYITVTILSVILHITFEVPMSKITTYLFKLIWSSTTRKAAFIQD